MINKEWKPLYFHFLMLSLVTLNSRDLKLSNLLHSRSKPSQACAYHISSLRCLFNVILDHRTKLHVTKLRPRDHYFKKIAINLLLFHMGHQFSTKSGEKKKRKKKKNKTNVQGFCSVVVSLSLLLLFVSSYVQPELLHQYAKTDSDFICASKSLMHQFSANKISKQVTKGWIC